MPRRSDRAATALVTTDAWCGKARQALRALGWGSFRKCCAAVHCSPTTLTQIVKGDIRESVFVGPISAFLGIRPPRRGIGGVGLTEFEERVLMRLKEIPEEDCEKLLWVIDRMLSPVPPAASPRRKIPPG